MRNEEPYFFTNDEWYKCYTKDDGSVDIVLTDAAPQKAVDSFSEWLQEGTREDVVLDLEDE
jgi:hypothetical protein